MVKIKKYKVAQAGLRGLKITIPQIWAQDCGLKLGDSVIVYRDSHDRLILEVEKVQAQS